MAAVDAVLAPMQVAAATLTVRQTAAAGRPVRGSIRWCSSSPPRSPASAHDARRGQAAALDDDGRSRSVGGRVVLVGEPDDPAAERGSGHGDVAAEADEHAGAAASGRSRRCAVGAPGLGRRSEVELDAVWHR